MDGFVPSLEALEALARAVRARKAALAVETPEPHRFLRGLKLIATNPFFPNPPRPDQQPFRLAVWSPHAGFQEADTGRRGPALWAPDEAETADPTTALRTAWRAARALLEPAADPNLDGVLWVFRLADRAFDDPAAVGLLEDIRELGRSVRHTLILTGPVLELPPALARTVYRLDFPLPTAAELTRLVELFFQERDEPLTPEEAAALARTLQGLTWDEADEALADAYIAVRGDRMALPARLIRAKAELIRRVPALEFVPPAGLEDIGGLENLKAFARELRATFTEKARRLGARPPRGILLVGVPGTGKSLAAKALAGDLPVIRLDMGAVYGSLLGQSEATLRQALRTLEAAAPVVAWVDELEKATGAGDLDGGTSLRVLGTLLTWMQERAQERGVVVVATANDVSRLRPELLERFSYRFFVDLPGPRARAEILRIHLRKRGHDLPDEALAALARQARGHSGRSLELCVERALQALAAGEGEATPEALAEQVQAATRRTPPLVEQAADAIRALQAVRDRFEPAQDPAADPEEETAGPTGSSRKIMF
jgi:AAA+ superfamily predicted ATPase